MVRFRLYLRVRRYFYGLVRKDVYGLVKRIRSRRFVVSDAFHEGDNDKFIYDVRLGG